MRKDSNVKKTAAAVLFLLAGISGVASAAGPVLEGFSNSKTGDDKTMFLVKPGEQITFSVRAEGAPINEWTVNKKVAKNPAGMGLKSNSLAWTVPNEKGIWEIHVTARGDKDGEIHAEWVVSTLTKEEAPTFFDSFTDKRYTDRKETDPWGRPLPKWAVWPITAEWTEWQELWGFLPGGGWSQAPSDEYKMWQKKMSAVDASGCFVQAPSEAPPNYPLHMLTLMSTKSEIEFGTWKLRFRFPNGRCEMKGGKTHLRFYYAHTRGYYGYSFWYGVACDGFQAFRVGANKFDNDEQFPVDNKWHEVTTIRTKDSEIYCFIDGEPRFRGKSARKTWKEDVSIYIGLARYQPDRYPKDTLYVDGVEAYEGRYIFPTKRVELIKGKAIITIGGRDVGLKEITETIKDPAIFSYDPANKQAVCKLNLTVSSGGDLVLSGETLKFEGAGKSLTVDRNATLRADNSAITGDIEFDRPFDVCLTNTNLSGIKGPLPVPAMAYGRWKFDGVKFPDAGTEFLLQGDTTRLNVYNSDFGKGEVKAIGEGKKPGVLGLVNCEFDKLNASKDAGIAPKYYLDVRVVDKSGKAVPNARVSIRNEVDDFGFPAENRQEFQPHGGGTSAYLNESVIPRLISYTTSRTTLTGDDGHSPGPKDAKKTLILTDFAQNSGGKKEFTYTITVEAAGATKVITGVNPGPEWYRPEPDKTTYTITAVLDGKTVTEAELKK